jgi:hypothetical protein
VICSTVRAKREKIFWFFYNIYLINYQIDEEFLSLVVVVDYL